MKVVLVLFSLASIILAACEKKAEIPSDVNSNVSILNSNSNVNTNANKRTFNNHYERFQQKQWENLEKRWKNPKEPPKEFKKFDFKNSTFFSSHLGRKIKLKNGEYEYQEKGKIGGFSARFSWADYFDLTGDGIQEAIVLFFEQSVGGSSFTTGHYFIYSRQKVNLKELWNFRTGSEAHCGDLGLNFDNGKISFELMGDCVFKVGYFENMDKQAMGDRDLNYLTKVTYSWNGKTFVQEKREVIKLEGE